MSGLLAGHLVATLVVVAGVAAVVARSPIVLTALTVAGATYLVWLGIALGLVHIASCAVIYTIVGTGARTLLRTRPTAARAVTRLSGGTMIVIGVLLIVEQFIA